MNECILIQLNQLLKSYYNNCFNKPLEAITVLFLLNVQLKYFLTPLCGWCIFISDLVSDLRHNHIGSSVSN